MKLIDAQARIAELEAKLKAKRPPLTLKVSQKGGVSLYGLGRFPVTLYREQWQTLIGMADKIAAFLTDNAGALKTKDA